MSLPGQKRRLKISRPPIQGALEKGQLLTAEGAWRKAGLGPGTLAKARQSGLVTPIWAGGRAYYRSDELYAWIESHAGKTPGNRRARGLDNGTDA